MRASMFDVQDAQSDVQRPVLECVARKRNGVECRDFLRALASCFEHITAAILRRALSAPHKDDVARGQHPYLVRGSHIVLRVRLSIQV